MRGSTIGGVVGGVIGFMVGGPAGAQWGWMIGSFVGGVVDPDVYEGPRLAEATQQTAQDGIPLIYGYGTFPCRGNLIWTGEVVEHRHKESSKGGPEQVSYTYTVSYAICVCKGPISGYKIIKRNGKIVYDARTDAELTALGYSSQEIAEARAAQAEFLQRATLYYGAPGQMPDPTMVAALGAGNVPAYTGIAYIALKDDETREGEVSQYEFVVAACGERTEDWSVAGTLLVTGTPNDAAQPFFSSSPASELPEFSSIPRDSGADIGAGHPVYFNGKWAVFGQGGYRKSTNLETWTSGTTPWSSIACRAAVGGAGGWMAVGAHFFREGRIGVADVALSSMAEVTLSSADGPVVTISSLIYAGGYYYANRAGASAGTLLRASNPTGLWEVVCTTATSTPGSTGGLAIREFFDIADLGTVMYATVAKETNIATQRFQLRRSHDRGATWPDVLTDTDRLGICPWHIAVTDSHIVVGTWGGQYVYTSADGYAVPHATGIATEKADQLALETRGRQIVAADGRFYLISGSHGDSSKANKCVVTEDGLAFSAPISLGVNAAHGIATSGGGAPPGMAAIPDSPGFYIDNTTGDIVGPPGTQIDPCTPSLGSIVADQCERRGVTARDVSELTDTVLGYRVAAPSTPQKNIQGLQPGYFFSASEFDGVLHFPKRGRDLTFALTIDDFVERDGDPIQWEDMEERSLARKVTVAYADPETSYAATTQQAERRAATIAAEGENTLELPVTGTKDWAAQAADKSIKVAWGEPQECTFHVSIAHAELVTGAEGTVPYTDGQPTVVRIERIEDEGLVRMVSARKTRHSLYESNASGASKPLPRFPGSNIRGPSDGLLLNIPVLIDQDDRPGIHWAAAGMLSGWQGGQLQIRRAGQWVVAGNVSASAGLGRLVNALPAHAGDLDTANVLRVQFNEELQSVSWINLLQERNPLAILRDDGTAEIIQFQTATEVSPNVFDLTTLLRGRLATVPDDHAAGARVVFLDDRVQYASLDPSDLGTTLEYRFISNGTDPDAAPIQTIELTTMESQREWPVSGLTVEQDGDDYAVTWLRRDRLGTDVLPIRSANWAGYEVAYSHAGGTGAVVVTTESHTFTLPGASDITFSVAQLNQFTGAGPVQTVTIP